MGGDGSATAQAPSPDPADATALAQLIIGWISEPFDLDGHQALIGASIGIAVGPNDGLRPDRLLHNANLALYRARSDARGTFGLFDPAVDCRMQPLHRIPQYLRR